MYCDCVCCEYVCVEPLGTDFRAVQSFCAHQQVLRQDSHVFLFFKNVKLLNLFTGYAQNKINIQYP